MKSSAGEAGVLILAALAVGALVGGIYDHKVLSPKITTPACLAALDNADKLLNSSISGLLSLGDTPKAYTDAAGACRTTAADWGG